MENKIYVYGHKNPDSDSICSAISLAHLKNQMRKENKIDPIKHFGLFEDGEYIARACGPLNDESKYILDRFNITYPEIVGDVRTQILDLPINPVMYVSKDTSLFEVWKIMEANSLNTIFVVNDVNQLLGIITQKDIGNIFARLLMEDNILASAKVSYNHLISTVQGDLLYGSKNYEVKNGQIYIMTADTELAQGKVGENSIVISSNDYEKLMYLLDQNIESIIISKGKDINESIINKSKEKQVVLINSPMEIYDIAKCIKQSIPASHFMSAENLIAFKNTDFVDDVKHIMEESKFRDFPVLNEDLKLIGMIDKSSVLSPRKKRLALVDHNEISQAVFGTYECDVVEIVDHHKLSTIETNSPLNVTTKQVGCSGTIVYSLYKQADIVPPTHIASLLCGAILSDTMNFKSPTTTDEDISACRELSHLAKIDTDELWQGMLEASLNFDDKTDSEILYQDFKKFEHSGFSFGIGQVLVGTTKDCIRLKERIHTYLEKEHKNSEIDMMGLLITDISRDGSELIFCGNPAIAIVESAFGKKVENYSLFLDGVVSRKKQIVPQLLKVLE